jgi:L-asparagine transporter-like permease
MNGIDPTGRFDEIEFAAKVAQVVTIIAAVTTGASLAYCLYKESKVLTDVLNGASVPENMGQDIVNCIIGFLKNLMSPIPSLK